MSQPAPNGHKANQVVRILALFMMALSVALILLARFAIYSFDHGGGNAVTGIATFFLLTSIWIWLIAKLQLTWLPRILLGLLPLLLVFGFLIRFEFDGFSGEMIPRFRIRGSERPIAGSNKERPSQEQPTGDMEASFPQLLGANRDGRIEGVQVSKDWTANPPKIRWKVPVGAGWAGMAIGKGRIVTLEQRGEEEWVSCFDLGSGKLLWNHTTTSRHYDVLGGLGPRSTPTIQGDYVYTLGATGQLLCLELASGAEVWKQELLTVAGTTQLEFEPLVKWGRAASPLLDGDMLVVPLGNLNQGNPNTKDRSLAAFQSRTGELLWIGGRDQISYSSPMKLRLFNHDYFLILNENTASLHEPQDGKQVWSHPWLGASNGAATCSQPLQIDEKRILLSKGYGGGSVCLEFEQGSDGQLESREVWKETNLLRTKFTSPVLSEGHIYGLSEGTLECVRAEDGKRKWKKGRFGHGQLLLVGDQLILSSEDGDLVSVEASSEGYKELGRLHVLEGITWNIPSIAGPWMLMRNGNEMACVELPLE